MRLMFGRSKSKRAGQRGAAAVEFALTLPFLVIMLLGTLDYGYYFYVGVNATEAARAGIMRAAQFAKTANAGGPIPNCTPSAQVTTVITAGQTAATDYMTANMGATMAGYTTAVVTCVTTPANPSWEISLHVDFPPASRIMHAGLPASPTAGRVRYKAPILIRRLN
jgi:Flp pilus assembly protein TadG